MPTFEYVTEIEAPVERVWAWYGNPGVALPALSDPADEVEIGSPVPEKAEEGLELTIRAKGLFGKRVEWVARYEVYVPPHPVVYGVEARFVDVQVSGPFRSWRHSHEFEAIGDGRTRMLDYVTYTLPGWPFSAPVDWLVVRRKLRGMFDYRRKVLARVFPAAGGSAVDD